MCLLYVLILSFLMVGIYEEYVVKLVLKFINIMYYSIKCIYFKF